MAPPVIKKPAPLQAPPSLGKKKKADFLPEAKAQVAVPSVYQRCLAGVELSRRPGAGERRLDAICKRNGWTWAIVCTKDRTTDTVTTTILVGTLFEGTAEMVRPFTNDPSGAWSTLDEAIGAVASNLEASYAPPEGT